jgi:hypothetical protein
MKAHSDLVLMVRCIAQQPFQKKVQATPKVNLKKAAKEQCLNGCYVF